MARKTSKTIDDQFREALQELDADDMAAVREFIQAVKETRPNGKTAKKFVPVTEAEAGTYLLAFGDWLRANCSPEAERALFSINFLRLAKKKNLSPDGQKDVTRARNELNKLLGKFLGVRHV